MLLIFGSPEDLLWVAGTNWDLSREEARKNFEKVMQVDKPGMLMVYEVGAGVNTILAFSTRTFQIANRNVG